MTNHRTAVTRRKKTIDTFQAKRVRGRPARMRPSEILGRAHNYQFIFDQVWDRLWPLLAESQSEAEVIAAFQGAASPYDGQFLPWIGKLALQVLREPKFPKRRSAQIDFFAESLAAVGVVTPRRSRDICAQERVKEKLAQLAHHIIRYEFYVECSCGYKGQSRDHGCPDCEAKIVFESDFTPISAFMG
jgi:hypothetical protein